MKKLLGILVLGLLWCNVGVAAISVDSYLKARKENEKKVQEFIDEHILGIGTGIFWSNASLQSEHGKANKEKPMYCQPEIALGKKNYINFLDSEIAIQKKMGVLNGNEHIAMLIVIHLKRIFPCE